MRIFALIAYAAVSIVVFLIGLIVVILFPSDPVLMSVGTSIMASALVSLAFTAIKYADDLSGQNSFAENTKAIGMLSDKTAGLGRLLTTLYERVYPQTGADERCIFDRQLTDQFNEVLAAVDPGTPLQIDIVGFSLYRFYRDQYSKLKDRTGLQMRIIVQDPNSPLFDAMAEQEGRDRKLMRREIGELLQGIEQHGTGGDGVPDISIRLFGGAATATIVRVNGIAFQRPRVINEGRDALFFFEVYSATSSPRCLRAIKEHFEAMWERSIVSPSSALMVLESKADALTP